jgi:hypothetical protein
MDDVRRGQVTTFRLDNTRSPSIARVLRRLALVAMFVVASETSHELLRFGVCLVFNLSSKVLSVVAT